MGLPDDIVPDPVVPEPMLPEDMSPDRAAPDPAPPDVCGIAGPMPLAIASCCSFRRRVAARASPLRRVDDADALPLMLFCTVVLFDRGAALAALVAKPTPIATARMILLFMPKILSCRALMED